MQARLFRTALITMARLPVTLFLNEGMCPKGRLVRITSKVNFLISNISPLGRSLKGNISFYAQGIGECDPIDR